MLYIILTLNLFLVLSLPIINPSLSADYNNGTSLNTFSQASEGVNSFKTSQFEPDLVVDSLINNNITSNSSNNTSFIKPIDKKPEQSESDNNLLNIQLSLEAGGAKTVNNSITTSDIEAPLPPIDYIFDQDLWSEANNQDEIPLNSYNGNKHSNFPNPLTFKPPQFIPNTIDLSLPLKKLALPRIASMLTPIRPLFVAVDKSSQLISTEVNKLATNMPIVGPVVKQLKSNGIPNTPGNSEFRGLMDSLIIAGDYYSYEE